MQMGPGGMLLQGLPSRQSPGPRLILGAAVEATAQPPSRKAHTHTQWLDVPHQLLSGELSGAELSQAYFHLSFSPSPEGCNVTQSVVVALNGWDLPAGTSPSGHLYPRQRAS